MLRLKGQGERRLDVELAGPDDAIPLIFHNGTPGAGIVFGPMAADGAERGIRHIAYSRPGYGGSDRDNVSGARAGLLSEHGHLSLGVDCYGRILDGLLEASGLQGRAA